MPKKIAFTNQDIYAMYISEYQWRFTAENNANFLAFCPEALYKYRAEDKIKALPAEVGGTGDIIAWHELDVDLNPLCGFARTHSYCPDTVCMHFIVDPGEEVIVINNSKNEPTQFYYDVARRPNTMSYLVWCGLCYSMLYRPYISQMTR